MTPAATKKFCAIQSNILACTTYQHIANCREWVRQFQEEYLYKEDGAELNKMVSQLFALCGKMQAALKPAVDFLNSIPGIQHSLSKTY